MADRPLTVGDFVQIDGKGGGQITEKVQRGFGTFFMVKLCNTEFEFEIEPERLKRVDCPAPDKVTVQTTTTQPTVKANTSRFQHVNSDDINTFIDQQSNKNTLTKTMNDLKLLNSFFNEPAVGETRLLHEIPVSELAPLLSRFLLSVKKSNSEDYEPGSLRGMVSSFDRQLRRYNYGEYIATGPGFAQVREVLKSKQKQLKRDGKGNLPRKSEAISDEELSVLWESKQMGASTPDSILQTLWFYNTVHFGLRGCAEHRDMCWGDINLKEDENGNEYLEFTERQTKTRTGENPRDVRTVRPKIWCNVANPERCPVQIYKLYAKKRPSGYSEPTHPFYIASTTKPLPCDEDTWFKRNPVGINKLQSMMKRMVQSSGINTDKRLSNHSARKYLVQKLNNNNVPANHIMQISGHKNISSINNYSHINDNQHKEISKILYSSSSTAHPNPDTDKANYTAYPLNQVNTYSTPSVATSMHSNSTSNINLTGGFQSLFAGPIHGGTFNVYINHANNVSPPNPPRKRLRIIESDSDSQ
ncbi:uncharacterized protein LOC123528196 [Mercenaria mercenaria]|uniref:uncharacterized protein LOC123528196 n=1 Tax=Mercenaria mercenaria TaxID=6596 RepID=UPI00234E3865|nr:uncharacterized protein LOC123528196 [Mercenaria mercenaria]